MTLQEAVNKNVATIGIGSYGQASTVHHFGEHAKISIGKYCSISDNVEFFLGGEHRHDWVSTYPFTVLWPEVKAMKIKGYPRDFDRQKPGIGHDIIIGNDVWIGYGATIMSGVKIGDGAAISARSFVYRSVKPYSIVGGNPADFLCMRFDKTMIDSLRNIAWWDWPKEKILANIELICSGNVKEFIAKQNQ
jgi:acetyltransferase-like isoleucine patch superfamily enzyme